MLWCPELNTERKQHCFDNVIILGSQKSKQKQMSPYDISEIKEQQQNVLYGLGLGLWLVLHSYSCSLTNSHG